MFQSLKELIDSHPQMREPLIHGLLREGEIMNLVSPPKVGGTMLSLQLALAVASGTSWLGFETVKKKVLYVDGDHHCEALLRRLDALCNATETPRPTIDIELLMLRGHSTDHVLSDLTTQLRTKDYGLAVIDPFGALVPGYEEFDNEKLANLYGEMDAAADRHRTCLVLTHRTHKNITMGATHQGSTTVARMADTHVVLRPSVDNNFYAVQIGVRSFPPVPEFLTKFSYPYWTRVEDHDA